MAPRGAPPKLNWDDAFDEYLLVHKPNGMPQYEFAASKKVDANWLSSKFAEIRRQRRLQSVKNDMPKVMLKALRSVNEALDEEPDRSPSATRTGMSVGEKAKISIEAFKAMADREGMSPQAVTLNMQQINQNKSVVTVAYFATAPTEVKELFQ